MGERVVVWFWSKERVDMMSWISFRDSWMELGSLFSGLHLADKALFMDVAMSREGAGGFCFVNIRFAGDL